MSTVPATYDEAMAEQLAAMANPADMVVQNGPDILKINYDEDSIFDRGLWVLGQRKDKEGKITDEGVLVDKIVILANRCRYTYFHEPTKETISTQIFDGGSQPLDKAEVAARVSALGGKLKFQIVLLGLAIVEGGKPKEFISYLGGVAYTPAKEHLMDVQTIITPTKKLSVPPFSHLTILGPTEKGKNGTVTYWTPSFKKGPIMNMEQIQFFAQARDKALEFVSYHNSSMTEKAAEKTAPPAAAPPVTSPSMGAYEAPTPDLGRMKSANPDSVPPVPHSTGDDVPFDVPSSPPGADEDAYDIEAAMAAILGKDN